MRSWNRLALAGLAAALCLAGAGAVAAKPPAPEGGPLGAGVKAAFIRAGDLWIKEGSRTERRLTTGEGAKSPRWSFDGQWLAYTKGEQQQELWVRRAAGGEGRLVSKNVGSPGPGGFQWSPAADKLAYQVGNRAYWIEAERPDQPEEAARDIGRFSWWPDGNALVASSAARLLPDGSWTQVKILRVPLAAQGDPARYELLYTLPKQSDDFFAVDTSLFKWSAGGSWMAFLAKPTASLSADANTLCVLSADGKTFQRVDVMASNAQWFQWAREGDRLAYIAGAGREAISNKLLKAAAIPLGKPALYTPAGYVDQGFAWAGAERIVASRAKERKEWPTEQSERPHPFLVDIGLKSREQKRLTAKLAGSGAYDPAYLPGSRRLVWVQSDRSTAKVMTADSEGREARVWIDPIDLGENFYEQWDWGAVLDLYEGN